jgi:hypothetical protein
MNYAIYFGLAFAGCFLALIMLVLFLSFFADWLLEDKENEIDK